MGVGEVTRERPRADPSKREVESERGEVVLDFGYLHPGELPRCQPYSPHSEGRPPPTNQVLDPQMCGPDPFNTHFVRAGPPNQPTRGAECGTRVGNMVTPPGAGLLVGG